MVWTGSKLISRKWCNWLKSQAEEIFSKKKSQKITNTRNGCLGGGALFITRVHDGGAGGDAYVCFHTCGAPKLKLSQYFKQYLWFFYSCPVWNYFKNSVLVGFKLSTKGKFQNKFQR